MHWISVRRVKNIHNRHGKNCIVYTSSIIFLWLKYQFNNQRIRNAEFQLKATVLHQAWYFLFAKWWVLMKDGKASKKVQNKQRTQKKIARNKSIINVCYRHIGTIYAHSNIICNQKVCTCVRCVRALARIYTLKLQWCKKGFYSK